jgi:predicted O-methyltransferase YrrM
MQFNKVREYVKDTPYITPTNGKELYDFIIKNNCTNILELGIAHGTASCYIAAALDRMGGGKLVCVDLLEAAPNFVPSIEEQISDLGLNKYVEIHRMKSGYNWFLHNEIKACSNNLDNVCQPKYDLIIIDGPKNWTIDSSSFYLADKLLKQNGWIIWDDYSWTYANANTRRDATDGIKHNSMATDEQQIAHIKEIFHLLVMQHPSYSNFIIKEEGDWVWAQKIQLETKKIHYATSKTVATVLLQLSHKIASKLKRLIKR